LVQLKEIIGDEKTTDQGAGEVPEQVDVEKNRDAENTSSLLNTIVNMIYDECEHECIDEAVRLLNAHRSRHSMDDGV
jgi:hypothetical protein